MQSPTQHAETSLVLIGLSGSGKSTLARLLAARLGWPWVDTDALVVERAGCAIAELFAQHGEAHFRDLEAAALRDVVQRSTHQSHVIATGGGIVLRAENRALLRSGPVTVVWLDAPTDTLLARLQADDEARPLVQGDAPAARLERLRTEREQLYRELAQQVVHTAGLTPEQVAAQIVAGLAA
jgi:shikimate kinase